DQYIDRLFAAYGNYNNTLDYNLFPGLPGSPSYNSNSFTEGLLQATGVVGATYGTTFGGSTPVPPSFFRP
ncbi:MAG: hypothetical protein WB973_02525, partial [Thermoanaerobaculia bacterium]